MNNFVHDFLESIRQPFSNDNLQIGSTYQKVSFVPKTAHGDSKPWLAFGSNQENYEKWIPEICGICCLKMIGDTFEVTNNLSLYQLTMKCLDKGGFKIHNDGSIAGIFHYPLTQLAQELGLRGSVEKELGIASIIEHLKNNRLVILSVDLNKIRSTLHGNHLILIHNYSHEQKKFLVHDCSFVVGKNGIDIPMTSTDLEAISNKKGVVIWKNFQR